MIKCLLSTASSRVLIQLVFLFISTQWHSNFQTRAPVSKSGWSCLEIAAAYQTSGAIGLFASNNEMYRKTDLFTRYIEPHQAGQWLSQNVAAQHGGSVALIHLLNTLYDAAIVDSFSSWYASESILHAAVWHCVITSVALRNQTTVWSLEQQFCEPFSSDRCHQTEACAYVQCLRRGQCRVRPSSK